MNTLSRAATGVQLLLEFLRHSEEPDYQLHVDDETGWDCFLEACGNHQVSPFVWSCFQKTGSGGLPERVQHQLRTSFYRVAVNNHFLATKLVELIRLLEDAGIPALTLKGPMIAVLAYGDLSLRAYGDIDLLVRREHLNKAYELFLSLGYRHVEAEICVSDPASLAAYHAVTLMAPGDTLKLDLHWDLAPDFARAIGPDAKWVWERAIEVPLPHGPARGLGREDLLVALCVHGTRHLWQLLKWLVDVSELLKKDELLDKRQIDEILHKHPQAQEPVSLAAVLMEDLLGVFAPASLASVLAPSGRVREIARTIEDEIRAGEDPRLDVRATLVTLKARRIDRITTLAKLLQRFPLKEKLFTLTEKDSEFVRLPAKLHFLYYGIRPFRLVIQHGKQTLQRLWSITQ